jgi:glycerol-3-phosphate acyltransferase PlsY
MLDALLVIAAYLVGSIPTGVLLSRLRGIDPRDVGSGNIGANNVRRAAGPLLGALTLAGDAAKGLLPVLIASWLGRSAPTVALVGLGAFVGHVYSCFLGFDGGKGVATALGALLGLAPFGMAITLPIFGLTVAFSRYVSLASLITAAATPAALAVLGYPATTVMAAAAMSITIGVRHRDNIRRIRFGTEARIGDGREARADSGVA